MNRGTVKLHACAKLIAFQIVSTKLYTYSKVNSGRLFAELSAVTYMAQLLTCLQFYEAQLDILIVFILMPLTDLPGLCLSVVFVYALITATIVIPYNFLDTFLLTFEQSYKNETQL